MTDVVCESFAEPAGEYLAPGCSVAGDARGARFAPAGYSLWELSGVLEPGATISWGEQHGDHGIVVVEGELRVERDGEPAVVVGSGGAVVIESDAMARVRAASQVRLLHFGPAADEPPGDGIMGPPLSGSHDLHVHRSAADAPAVGEGPVTRFFADGTCERCRIALFTVASEEGYVGRSHVHSEDEIIHVLEGTLRVGTLEVGAGSAIAVPAGRRYSFRSAEAFRFVNYRRDVSTFRFARGVEQLETLAGLEDVIGG